ncbi:MAG: prefoldin subunit alpha [Candidatus Aenigmatarchaeota archaeon]
MTDELQKLVIQFQILEANLKLLQERSEIINEKIEEMQKTKLALEELKQIKLKKALIPLGSGNFILGIIENTENVIVGIGSSVAIKKKREDALKILESNLKELEESSNEITEQIAKIALELEKIQNEIEKLQK